MSKRTLRNFAVKCFHHSSEDLLNIFFFSNFRAKKIYLKDKAKNLAEREPQNHQGSLTPAQPSRSDNQQKGEKTKRPQQRAKSRQNPTTSSQVVLPLDNPFDSDAPSGNFLLILAIHLLFKLV